MHIQSAPLAVTSWSAELLIPCGTLILSYAEAVSLLVFTFSKPTMETPEEVWNLLKSTPKTTERCQSFILVS